MERWSPLAELSGCQPGEGAASTNVAQRPNPRPLPVREGASEEEFPSTEFLSAFFSPSRTGRGRGLGLRSRRSGLPGFTLIEIAVVIFLMGLMMLIAMPYIGGISNTELKSASRRLAGRATYLYDEALARKLVIQLIFDMDHNGYFVMVADPYSLQPTFFPDLSPSGARVLLPDSVRIRDVTVEGIGTVSRGTLATMFYPEGYVDATLIHLVDQRGRVMTLRIDPLTGQVAIAKGDIRPNFGGR